MRTTGELEVGEAGNATIGFLKYPRQEASMGVYVHCTEQGNLVQWNKNDNIQLKIARLSLTRRLIFRDFDLLL